MASLWLFPMGARKSVRSIAQRLEERSVIRGKISIEPSRGAAGLRSGACFVSRRNTSRSLPCREPCNPNCWKSCAPGSHPIFHYWTGPKRAAIPDETKLTSKSPAVAPATCPWRSDGVRGPVCQLIALREAGRAHFFCFRFGFGSSGMIRFMNSSKSGTVKAVSPCWGL